MKHYFVSITCRNGHDRIKIRNGAARWAIEAADHSDGTITGASGNEVLVGESPVPARDVFGNSQRGGGPLSDEYARTGRNRTTLACRRCGLHLVLRQETAQQVVAALLQSTDTVWTPAFPDRPEYLETKVEFRKIVALVG